MTCSRHISWDKPRGWLCLALACLAGVPVRLPAQPPNGEEPHFKWMRLQITEAGIGVEAEGESEVRRLKGSPTSLDRGYLYVAPMLDLAVQGSFYHPNLVQFRIKAEDGLSFQQQYLNEPVGTTPAGTESKTRFLQRYHASLDILKEKPYAVSVFADKDHNFRKFDFFNQATVDTERFGLRAGYNEGPLPFHVEFIHLFEDVTGYTRPSTLDENMVNFDMRNDRSRNSLTTLTYSLDHYNRQEEGFPEQTGTYHTVNLSDTEVWGKNDNIRLNSSLYYNRLDDNPVPTESLMLMEHAAVEHSKTLASDYNYSFDTRSSGPSDSMGNIGQASLRHNWRDCLTSVVDLHAQNYDSSSPGSSLSGYRYGVGWSESFAKRVAPWCDLNAGYSGRYDIEHRETSGQTLAVIGEPHILKDGVITYLNQPRVIESTIRVTDTSGKVYQLLLDYLVINHGDLTEIKRAPGASIIPDGGAVLVDYQAYLDPSDDFNTIAQQFQVRVDFFNHLVGVYGRLNFVRNPGANSLVVQDITDQVLGTDISWRWFRAGAEYEDYQSDLGPFTTKRLFQSFNFDPTASSHLSIDLDQTWTTFNDDGRRRTAYNFIARYNAHLTSHLAWNLEGGWRVEHGEGFEQQLGVIRTELTYTRGKLSVKLGYDYQDQDYLGELRRRNFFYLKARRAF